VDFTEKYGAVPFDENSHNDAVAERARRAVLQAYTKTISKDDELAPRQLEFILAGLLVGVVQVVQASAEQSDQADAAIRSSIIQTAPWAVDHARAQHGLDPLVDT